MQQQGVGPLQVHGIPGTPVGDLFPPGNAVFGDGNRSSIRPIRAGELRSHSAGYEPNAPYGPRGMRENRGRNPRGIDGEVLGQSIRMVGQFLHLRQGDHEQMASRVTFELEEQTAATVREAHLRDEYAQAASELRTELSEEAAQRFQYLEHQQNIFAQARLRTVESALGTEYAQAQENLQRQYLTQVQGLHNELQTAQRQFSERISQERTEKDQEIEALTRELAGKAQLAREQADDLQKNVRMHREMHENEEARVHETLAAQAEQWKIHCDALTQQCDAGMAQYAERIAELEREIEELSGKYIETSEKLEQWDLWWQESGTQAREAETSGLCPEGLETIGEEERRSQPTTPFVQSQPTIPQEFLPPPLPPKFAPKNFPERANRSDESSHTGMDSQAVPTFAAPTTPPSAPKHTPPAMTSSPPSPFAGPWAATREKLQSSNPVNVSDAVLLDINSLSVVDLSEIKKVRVRHLLRRRLLLQGLKQNPRVLPEPSRSHKRKNKEMPLHGLQSRNPR